MIRAHTYSVVMRDPGTGRFGVAVQSHWFNVGSIVPWVRPGVGAVATQSVAEPRYGPRGLKLMADGLGAAEAMERLLAEDEGGELRQLGFVDARGGAAAHTGSRCIPFAGHAVGDGWTVQANIMRNDRVVPAMAEAVESGEGDLAGRLLAVLEAAEATGGDLRGSQSAALRVSGDGPVPLIDLRVEDHPDPVGELRRLLGLQRAYDHMEAGDEALGAGDGEGAAAEYAAAAALAGANPEVRFWQAATMAETGRVEEAREIYAGVLADRPDLGILLERLPATGLMSAEVAEALGG
jgi:uncharacterized Ntn-hydrolase superfamily protein